MDQDGTWHGRGPWSVPHCARWGHSYPSLKGAGPPIFGPFLLCPNSWMHQDGTCYGDRLQPRRLCVRWGPTPSQPPKRGGANVRCGQTARWTKVALGMEVGLAPVDFAQWGPSYPRKEGTPTPPNCWPMSIVAKRLDGSRCYLIRR